VTLVVAEVGGEDVAVLSEGVAVAVGDAHPSMVIPMLNLQLLLPKTSHHRSRTSPNLLLISQSQTMCRKQMGQLRLL
jgi:hypothetical protein